MGEAAAWDDKVARSAEFWNGQNVTPREDVEYWLGVPRVREHVNRVTTGQAGLTFLEKFLLSIADRLPVGRVLSVGCGSGGLERGLAHHGVGSHIDGIDVGEESLRAAREQAAVAGHSGLHYHLADAASWLRGESERGYDLIFFHMVLHHLEDLEEVFALTAAALRRGSPGLVFIDEYIGPSRHEWTSETLAFAAGLFPLVPPEHRRIPQVWPPVVYEDPTEMIRSSEIGTIAGQHLSFLEYRPYYGNVLNPLVCAIKASSLAEPAVVRVIDEAIALESYLADRGLLRPLFGAAVGRPRPLVER